MRNFINVVGWPTWTLMMIGFALWGIGTLGASVLWILRIIF